MGESGLIFLQIDAKLRETERLLRACGGEISVPLPLK
jgi:hypothetical protein